MLEKLIFNLLAASFFIVVFFKMARKNNTTYISILILESIGILINFLEINALLKVGLALKSLEYLLAIIIPGIILFLEFKQIINYNEITLLMCSKYYALKKDTENNKQMLLKFVEKDFNSILAHKLLAEFYEKEENFEKAIEEIYFLLQAGKEEQKNYLKLGELYNKINEKDKAINILSNYLKENADAYKVSILLGELYYDTGKFKKAIDVYTDALKYKVNDYNLYYFLGMTYIMLNDFSNAEICYKRAAELNSKSYISVFMLGKLSILSNDMSGAEQYFVECLSDEEIQAKAYYELAKIYMLKGERDKAIIFIKNAIELDLVYLKLSKEENVFRPVRQYIKTLDINTSSSKSDSSKKMTVKEEELIKKLNSDIELSQTLGFKEHEKEIKRIEKDLNKEH